MTQQRPRALLLLGSHREGKGTRSTSESLGTYLLEGLRERGFEIERLHLKPWLRHAAGRLRFLRAVEPARALVPDLRR